MGKSLSTAKSNSEVFFRLNTSQDYDSKILKTLNKIFPHVTLSKEWYEWFTYQSPQGECLWFIGEDKNDIVSTYGFLPMEIMIDGRLWDSVLAVNTGVISSYWGKGVYQEFSKFSLSTVLNKLSKKLIIAIPNKIGYIAHLRLGWTERGKFTFVNLPRDKVSEMTYENKGERVEETGFSDISEKLNEFIRATSSQYEFFAMKDINFIKWRYSRPDYKDSYRFGLLRQDKEIYGYIVIKIYENVEEFEKKIHIMDINYKTENSFAELIGFACKIVNEEEADILNTWVYMDSELYDDFLKIGFEEDDVKRPLMVYTTDAEVERLIKRIGNIHLVLGDNDIY